MWVPKNFIIVSAQRMIREALEQKIVKMLKKKSLASHKIWQRTQIQPTLNGFKLDRWTFELTQTQVRSGHQNQTLNQKSRTPNPLTEFASALIEIADYFAMLPI